MSRNLSPPELEFDQTERITARLRDLVRNYPKGLGLVKEFLQNADDAGASKLLMIYDRRRHSGSFPDPAMNVALGPALLFKNDQTFTNEDFQRIQQIGEGGKVRDAARTGRFGQGFNTCYSVTDSPSLLTGHRIAWFDPHHRAFNKGKNAYAWLLTHVESFWLDWARTFTPAGWQAGAGSFPGTVFRLPLRSIKDAEQSEILQEPFTEDDFNAILRELQQIGAALLVFLRSVVSLEVREIDTDGGDHLRFWVYTTNEVEVDRHRKVLRSAVDGSPKELLEHWLESAEALPVEQFDHSFFIHDMDGTEREETWAVTSGLFRGPEDELLHAALEVWKHQEKAIPWAGAAVRRGAPVAGPRPGGLACFLPLPELIGWPVWLHGWLDLGSNRRGITRSGDVGATAHARYAWNQSLMEHAVGKAWALLVQQVAGQAAENAAPYDLWPRAPDRSDELDEALLTGFYRAVAGLPVVRGLKAEGHHWHRLDDGVRALPAKWHERLLKPFLAEGWSVCDPPVPDFVRRGLEKARQKLPALTPAALRTTLKAADDAPDLACALVDAPRPMLAQREWICALAEFCAEGDWNKLGQLPLALLADGLLHTFTACGTLCLVDEKERVLLEPLPARLLDTEYQEAIRLDKPAEGIDIVKLDLGRLLACIPDVLASGAFNWEWLTAVFDYFTTRSPYEVNQHAERMKALTILPDQHGYWCEMGFVNTPLIPGEIIKALQDALTRLGIPLLHGPKELVQAISRFAYRHDGFLGKLTPGELADNLALHAENPALDEAALDDHAILFPLLDFLASTNWLSQNDDRLPLLRQVRMLPTACGQRAAAQSADVYVPGGFHPPMGVEGQYRVLDTGQGDRWRQLFEALGVPALDGSTFVEKVLLPAFARATHEQRHGFLVWLRDDFRLVERELDEERRKQLRQKIRRARILPIESGGLAAAWEVYQPDAEETLNLLGEHARIPDKNFFATQQDLWREFFREFDLPRSPLARDLLAAIQTLVDEAGSAGASAVRDRLRKLVGHVRARWIKLADITLDGGVTLAGALAHLAWLPAAAGEGTNYAACANWPDRLWRADEFVPPRLANLVASKRPVLDGPEFPEPMSKALGLITQVDLSDVLNHFSKVRALPIPEGTAIEAIRRAATEVYRFIGQLDASRRGQWQADVASLSELPCVLVGGVWWHPDRCFFDPLPFVTSWAASLTGAELSQIRAGLERLGVRPCPTNDDWLRMLGDLAEEFDRGVLPPTALNQARQALRRLRSAPTDWLLGEEILVPLTDGRLNEARLSLVPDDPRLDRINCTNPLPLIENNEDAIDVGRRAGARSLRSMLVDRLNEPPKPTQDSRLQAFATEVERRIRSIYFHKCLRRIAYEEALRRGDSDQMAAASESALDRPRNLQVRITPAIHVESVVDIDGEEIVAFEISDAASFLDKDVPLLWLKERSRRSMKDELVRALCQLCGLTDQLRLSRVLEAEPEEMSRLLDEDDVATLPEGRTLELDNAIQEQPRKAEEVDSVFDTTGTNNAGNLPEEDADKRWGGTGPAATKSELEDATGHHTPGEFGGGARHTASCSGQRSFDPSQHGDAENLGLPDDSKGNPAVELGTEPKRTPTERSSNTPNGIGPRSSGSPGKHSDGWEGHPAVPPGAPISPGQGSSRPWGGALPGDSGKTKQVRLRSYVHERDQTDYDTGDAEPSEKETGTAGELITLSWEKKQGRVPRAMPPNNEGYDIESTGPNGMRYIEVKGIHGPWGARGVGVTRAQYDAALRLGQAWWLYVVEYANDAARAVVHPIQNPFHQATEYRFDAGWRAARPDQGETTQPQGHPEQGAHYQRDDGEGVMIVEATPRGTLWRVKIELSDGSTETVTWNPNWRRA